MLGAAIVNSYGALIYTPGGNTNKHYDYNERTPTKNEHVRTLEPDGTFYWRK